MSRAFAVLITAVLLTALLGAPALAKIDRVEKQYWAAAQAWQYQDDANRVSVGASHDGTATPPFGRAGS